MVVRRDKRLKLDGTNLIISHLEPEDSGHYDCEIEADSDRPISVTHKLDILIAPQVRATLGYIIFGGHFYKMLLFKYH